VAPRVALLALLLIGASAGVGWVWWHQHRTQLPPRIASGNGRLESDEIDIEPSLPAASRSFSSMKETSWRQARSSP
jgi:hypothetical protein